MAERIPQSVSFDIAFKAYLSSDHVSPATSKTIVITISKNKAGFVNPSAGATNASEIANGWYYVNMSTTDAGTLGPLIVHGAEGTIDNVDLVYQVVGAFNAGFTGIPAVIAGGSSGLPLSVDTSGRVDVLKVNGTSQTARDLGASVLISSGTGTGQLSVTSGVIDANVSSINSVSTSSVTTVSAYQGTTAADAPQTGDSYAIVNSGTYGNSAIKSAIPSAAPTAAAVATAVWQDTTAGDLNVSGSIGKSLFTSGNAPGASSGLAIVGSIMGKSAATLNASDVTGNVPATIKAIAGGDTAEADKLKDLVDNGYNSTTHKITEVATVDAIPNTTVGGYAVGQDPVTLINANPPNVNLVSGQLFIKKNTALNNFSFVMTDATTNNPKPALTVSATRRIDSGVFVSCANAVTEVANGWYNINLGASDLNGTIINFRMTATGANDLNFTVVTQT